MWLSLGCCYALRAGVPGLAARRPAGDRPRHRRGAAAPKRFLLRPLKALVTAGLLRSAPGPGGGYRLGRPAARITLLEVVEAVDGPIRGEPPPAQAAWARLDSRLGGGLRGRGRSGPPPAGRRPPLGPLPQVKAEPRRRLPGPRSGGPICVIQAEPGGRRPAEDVGTETPPGPGADRSRPADTSALRGRSRKRLGARRAAAMSRAVAGRPPRAARYSSARSA